MFGNEAGSVSGPGRNPTSPSSNAECPGPGTAAGQATPRCPVCGGLGMLLPQAPFWPGRAPVWGLDAEPRWRRIWSSWELPAGLFSSLTGRVPQAPQGQALMDKGHTGHHPGTQKLALAQSAVGKFLTEGAHPWPRWFQSWEGPWKSGLTWAYLLTNTPYTTCSRGEDAIYATCLQPRSQWKGVGLFGASSSQHHWSSLLFFYSLFHLFMFSSSYFLRSACFGLNWLIFLVAQLDKN